MKMGWAETKADLLQEIFLRVTEGKWLAEEEEMNRFLGTKVPHLQLSFPAWVETGRKTVLKHLLEAMVREDLFGLWSDSIRVSGKDKQPLPLNGEKCEFVLMFSLSRENWLALPVLRSFAFRRMYFYDPYWGKKDNWKRIKHAVELLYLLREKEKDRGEAEAYDWEKFALEMANASTNQTLCFVVWESKKEAWKREAKMIGAEHLLQLVEAKQKMEPSFDSSLYFEQFCVKGHHLHPGAKTKMGMEPRAVFDYSPELMGKADLRFVAVNREVARWSLPEGEEWVQERMFRFFPGLKEAVSRQLEKQGKETDAYTVVPVHPWQFKRIIPKVYEEEIRAGRIVPIESFTMAAQAMASFRTVQPLGQKERGFGAIKVAVGSQMTSTIRSISPQTAHNAPHFSSMMREVLAREPELQMTFAPVSEWAGFYFFRPGAGTDQLRNLSAVLREPVYALVQEGEIAIAGTALYAESPLSERPILADLLTVYHETNGKRDWDQSVLSFIREYAETVLPGYLTLMVKYGIGLEGHLQNSLPVFKGGRPVRLLVRDWGGARIYRERLNEHGIRINWHPGSLTLTHDPDKMRNKVFYTVFQSHLGEIIVQACGCSTISEADCWKEIAQVTKRILDRLAFDPACRCHAEEDRWRLFQKELDHKALTLMRLKKNSAGDCYRKVPNPLHGFE
jgi:siderophore synthetase component